jgi:multiple sugar transport system permease protein
MLNFRYLNRFSILRGLKLAGTVVVVLLALFPLYWTLNYSLLPEKETVVYPPHYYPPLDVITLRNYIIAFTQYPMLSVLLNSVFIVGVASLITLSLSFLPAYVIAKHNFRLKDSLYYGIMALLAVPWVSYVVPLYTIASALGLIDTHLLMIMLYGFSGIPLFTWIAIPFVRALPDELIDTGRIYGLSEFGIIRRIAAPVLRNALIALFLLRFVWAYGDLLYQLVFTIDKAKMILPEILEFPGLYEMPYARMAVGGIVGIAPILVFVIVFQKYIVSGLTQGLKISV